MNGIADRLKEERSRLGITQEVFAKEIGVSSRSQINYEKGIRKPDSEYLYLASMHGLDINYIITGNRTIDLKTELNLVLDAYSVIDEKLKDKKVSSDKKKEMAIALYELYKETDSKSEKLADTVLKLVVNG